MPVSAALVPEFVFVHSRVNRSIRLATSGTGSVHQLYCTHEGGWSQKSQRVYVTNVFDSK